MQSGVTTVVMGLSGSGKSTLIRHLNRLIEPTDGEILVDGVDVMNLSTTDLRQMRQNKMSMVFQKFALLPHRTVLQNAAMALDIKGLPTEEQEQEAKNWLARVGLGGFENHYPAQLSGGMQQRVGIARALTSNSDIMLMDEAFSALEPRIRPDLQTLYKNTITLICSSPNSTSKLMQLRKPKTFGTFNNHNACIGNISTDLNHCSSHHNLSFPFHKTLHFKFFVCRLHLSMHNTNLIFRCWKFS